MKRFIVLFPLLALAAASFSPADAATHRTHPYVIRDVFAGRDRMHPTPPEQKDTAIEPSIAVNPENPNNAVAVYQEGRVDAGGDQDNGYAATFDGGRTWTYGDLPGLTQDVGGPWDRASDAVVAFGPNNVVYANSLVFNDTTNQGAASGLVVNVSTDGGKTWGAPIDIDNQQANPLDDKNWISVDNSDATGHHLGRAYVVWDRVVGVFVSYSDDQGQTWTPPYQVFSGQGIGAIPLVAKNGDLAVVFNSFTQPGWSLVRPEWASVPVEREAPLETNPGETDVVVAVAPGAGSLPFPSPPAFEPPIVINSNQGNAIRQQRAGGLPTADVNQKSGRIYVGWEDGRFRSDDANDAVVTWSDDEGQTWHRLKRVNGGSKKNWVDHYNTMLAVGPDGSLRVAYLQRKEAANTSKFSHFVDVYYQQSLNGGRTFSAPLRIDRRRLDVRFSAFSRAGAFFGDYNQLAAAGSRTYVVTCRSYRLHRGEPATFPPTVHHQRTWVTVVHT
jgi:hypothetical protein